MDGEFNGFAQGVASGRYAFWLGSGISLFRFPGLKKIVIKALEYLRAHVDPAQVACPFKVALERALGIASLTDDEKALVNVNVPVVDWAIVKLLEERLSGKYAEFLNIDIDGQPLDVMVWEAVDVVGTYADETVAPDAEHYVIAAMIKEGLVTELPSANWDGLIEKAVDELGNGNGLKVCVRSEDLQAADQKATLTKFHGCAVRARDDEGAFRPYLVGAQRQIDGWSIDAKVAGLVQHLIDVAISKPTLLLGFSAQDANIRTVFALAAEKQNWEWPGELPAYVIAEDIMGEAQTTLLANVYRNQFAGGSRVEIKKSAHLQAYAKPLLTALLLWTYAAKLQRMARLGDFDLSEELAAWVDDGIVSLRDQMAEANTGDHLAFVEHLICGLSRGKRLFLSGRNDAKPTRYEPLTTAPVSQMVQDVETETNGTPQAAVIGATLAKGVNAGDWILKPSADMGDRAGVAALESNGRCDRVFIIGRPEAELALYESEAVLDDDEDAILIHARPIHERLVRSPSRAPGRTGAVAPRRVSMSALVADVNEPSELMERFKQEAGL